MEFEDNDEYNPVPPMYYDYKGKSYLTLDYKNELFEYCDINIFAYTINKEKKYPFVYVYDETQEIAKKFNAVCTPDLFLFLKDHESEKFILNYKGRLNNFSYIPGGPETSDDFGGKKHELLEYTKMILKKPITSMGCSIKWKNY
jgi:hypothetical protein